MPDLRYQSFMGLAPERIGHWEHWSNPDAATWITGVDFYASPRTCMARLNEMYPFLNVALPPSDDPLPRPEEQADRGKGRWGHAYREYWQQQEASSRFAGASIDEMLRFSPIENADFSAWRIPEAGDYRSEEAVYRRLMDKFGLGDDPPPPETASSASFYNTMFMWPMLVFGYENFMMICLEPGFERIMDEFAEINRRVFRALARLPVHFIISHDDIALPTGAVCSPRWMRKYIFPRYEEFWGIVKAAGKEVIFMGDGCMDPFADDLMACGARGVVTEPFTDFKAIARKHKDCFIAGEGDNRVLTRSDPAEIRAMVETMVETAQMSGGYMMCIGNHIPFNVPGPSIKLYLDLSHEMGYRKKVSVQPMP